MKLKHFFVIPVLGAAMAGCKPDPIDIDVPQSASEMTISSITPDTHTLYVSAGYSISSMRRIADTSKIADYKELQQDMLIDSGLVLLRADGGQTDTLPEIGKGLYGRKDLDLQPGAGYTLIVEDRRKGKQASARTSFMPRPSVDTMSLHHTVQNGTTLNKLQLRLAQAQPGERYLVCYNTAAAMRMQQRPLQRNLSALYDFQPRRLEILRVPDTCRGPFETAITLQVNDNDTVLVQVSRIDGNFSDYLSAYKRSGSFFSQLSGEPVNLPGNVQQGFGYFAMYLSHSALFDLSKP